MKKEANLMSTERIIESEPWLVDVLPASQCIPEIKSDLFLHAGPPIGVDELPEPTRYAIGGAQVYEGSADTVEIGIDRLRRGEVTISSAHDHGAIAPMTGIVTPSMPMFVIENRTFGNKAYTNINEGVGKTKTLRFGAFDRDVLARLNWMRDVLAPSLRNAIRSSGGINLRQIIAEAVRRGDECHNRNKSASLIFFQKAAISLSKAGYGATALHDVLQFIGGNEHFFLNLSMAAAKASLDAGHGVKGSSIVTAMSANGKDFAIRVSGLGSGRPPYTWFRSGVPAVRGKYFEPYSAKDACPILGDSFAAECTGLGAFALAAAPAMTEFVGGTISWANEITKRMYRITTMEHSYYKIPYLAYRGVPTGISIGKVLARGLMPVMDVGIAHRSAGIGQIGAGLFRAPKGCFRAAGDAFESAFGRRP
ncbi:MAG: DUF1116 domain-containing protein [Thaumarchaeota archaeon]|nr:DUF1116 domain-containing protein [Nitrososphaerota archaeon]